MYRLVLLFLFPFLLFAQYEEEQRVLETLCSEAFGGRGYVNGGDSIAAEFLAKEFNKLGLKPIGKSYFQPFRFDINTFPENIVLKIGSTQLTPGKDFLVNPASGSSNVTTHSRVFTLNDFQNGTFSTEIERIRNGQLIPVIDPEQLTNHDTLQALMGLAHELAGFTPVIILQTHLSWHTSQRQLKHALIEVNRDSFEEGEIELKVKAVLKKHTARNVIADIPASGKAKRTIVFTAHYDHLGRMGQNTYFPGANDNGSGTAMLLSLASQLISKPSSTRYIFIAFAGEEVALLGSKYFVENPTFKLNTIDFLINLDILGGAQQNITVVNGTEFKSEFEHLVSINEEHNYLPAIKARKPTANSDHYWFFEKGIKCFYIYSAGDNKHYHVPEDHAKDVDMKSFMNIRSLLLDFVTEY